MSGSDPADVVFVYGPLILVTVTVLLSYAVGLATTRSVWGGYIAASLLYVVLVPNVYDRNLRLANESEILWPNFYQLHYYALRYAKHSVSGEVAMLVAFLAAAIALREETDRMRVGALTLVSLSTAALMEFRPQFALAVIPASGFLQLWFLARHRRWSFLIPPVVFVLLFVLARSVDTADASTSITLQYGVFGADVLRESAGYLPSLARRAIAIFPVTTQPALGIASLMILRIIGLNYLLLILWGLVESVNLRVLRPFSLYLSLVLVAAFVAAAFAEQPVWPANLGMNILMACRVPVVLLAAPMVLEIGRRLRAMFPWVRYRQMACGAAALIVFTAVSYRGANAALHDRLDRAYAITAPELAAYRWIQSHTDTDAIIAADPLHTVNELGERIRGTNFLSGMTARRVYVERVTPFTRLEGERRTAQLRTFFSTSAKDAACGVTKVAKFDYVVEYNTDPVAAVPLPCLQLVFSGSPSVYRVVRQ